MKHLWVQYGLSGLPGSGRPSKATHDSVRGHPVVFRPPLHSECPHRTMGICLSAPSCCCHLLRRFLPIASEPGHPTGASADLGPAGKLADRSGRGRFGQEHLKYFWLTEREVSYTGVWRWGTNHWPVVCVPQLLPAAPHVALGPSEQGATSRNRGRPSLWDEARSCLLSTGWGLTSALHLMSGLDSKPG